MKIRVQPFIKFRNFLKLELPTGYTLDKKVIYIKVNNNRLNAHELRLTSSTFLHLIEEVNKNSRTENDIGSQKLFNKSQKVIIPR